MIEVKTGNILEAQAQALVNTVNCVGVMGRGIALQFRKAFPDNYNAYKKACDRNELQPGKMFVFDLGRMVEPQYIINFPTKRHWKEMSRIEDIDAGLKTLVDVVRELGVSTVAIPPLGCGLGGLDWKEVRSKIELTFSALPEIQVLLYQPKGAPSTDKIIHRNQAPNMTVGRAALLGLMHRYLHAVMDPSITLLEIHKLMYFLQEAGQQLRLDYQKAAYGPYATNLRHVLEHIDGYFISGFGDAEDNPGRQIEVYPDAVNQAEKYLQDHSGTREYFNDVASLISGFETPFGMELLSTVHWVATREGATTVKEAIRETYSWGERKRMFGEDHIRTAWDVLLKKQWIGQ